MTIRIWNPKRSTCLTTLSGHKNDVSALAVLPHKKLISLSEDGTIRIWDIESNTRLATLSGHENDDDHCLILSPTDSTTGCALSGCEGDGAHSLAVLPEDRLALGGDDGTIRIWDTKNNACLARLSGHTDSIWCFAIFSDGRLASGGWDNTIRVWDLRNNTCLAILSGHEGPVSCLTVLSDDRLISGSHDSTIRVWDPNRGTCLAVLNGHTDEVNCLVSLENDRLVSGSSDSTIRVWEMTRPVNSEELTQLLRALQKNHSVKILNFSHLNLSANIDDLVALFTARTDFIAINLASTGLNDEAAQKILIPLYENRTIKRINVSHNLINPEILSHFAALIRTVADPDPVLFDSAVLDKSSGEVVTAASSNCSASASGSIEGSEHQTTSMIPVSSTTSTREAVRLKREKKEHKKIVARDEEDYFEHYPLHGAIKFLSGKERKNKILALLGRGLDPVGVDDDGKTALQVAQAKYTDDSNKDNKEIIEIIEWYLATKVEAVACSASSADEEKIREEKDTEKAKTTKVDREHVSFFSEKAKDPERLTDTESASPPHEFFCPITQNLLDDPVSAPDGYFYERSALQNWYDIGHRTCPINPSVELVDPHTLSTAFAFRNLISDWKEKHRAEVHRTESTGTHGGCDCKDGSSKSCR